MMNRYKNKLLKLTFSGSTLDCYECDTKIEKNCRNNPEKTKIRKCPEKESVCVTLSLYERASSKLLT